MPNLAKPTRTRTAIAPAADNKAAESRGPTSQWRYEQSGTVKIGAYSGRLRYLQSDTAHGPVPEGAIPGPVLCALLRPTSSALPAIPGFVKAVAVIETPRNWLRKLIDWIINRVPFSGEVAVPPRKLVAFLVVEEQRRVVLGLQQVHADIKLAVKELRRRSMALNDPEAASVKLRALCSDPSVDFDRLRSPLVLLAEQIWQDRELRLKIVARCKTAQQLYQFATTCDPTLAGPQLGLKVLLEDRAPMKEHVYPLLHGAVAAQNLEDALRVLAPFRDVRGSAGEELFPREQSNLPLGDPEPPLRQLLCSKASDSFEKQVLKAQYPSLANGCEFSPTGAAGTWASQAYSAGTGNGPWDPLTPAAPARCATP